jgi:hypothetical protein
MFLCTVLLAAFVDTETEKLREERLQGVHRTEYDVNIL